MTFMEYNWDQLCELLGGMQLVLSWAAVAGRSRLSFSKQNTNRVYGS